MEEPIRQKLLITDDSEMNRSILADMLGDEYEILEAENGVQAMEAIHRYGEELSLLLLDIVMPEMDGFQVLEAMKKQDWIKKIPVIMISSESGTSHVERAYELGAADFISRPFDALIVHHRVVNTILLYNKQKQLVDMVVEQIREKEEQSELMVDVLSHIVEFRNGESGLHLRHVHILTELLLQQLMQKSTRYQMTPEEIALITTASALHDIGKIAIAEDVLNKPGKLTEEELAVIKTHSQIGARMLEDMPIHRDKPLIKLAYEICRWHHERYDGKGYPDGLVGDAIPISAQIVALADVYDALTSDRVYKKAIPHAEAVQMIMDGQCGAFNPLLLECLTDLADRLPELLSGGNAGSTDRQKLRTAVREKIRKEESTVSDRTLQLLERERVRHDFYAALTEEIQFEYSISPAKVVLSPYGANKLGFPETILLPRRNEKVLKLMGADAVQEFSDALRATSPGDPQVTYDCQLNIGGTKRWFRMIARALWSNEEPPRYTGAIGKSVDIHNSRMMLDELEHQASSDLLTGLLNHTSARKRIETRIKERPHGKFALVIFDLDLFKLANDTYGHLFGDQLLKHLADKLRQSIRGGDIVARIGGDEFLIFMEYKKPLEPIVRRIYNSLCGTFGDFTITLSMGVAKTELIGTDYSDLFQAADRVLYTIKRGQRGKGAKYVFYDETMSEEVAVSEISPIDGEDAEKEGNQA